MIVNMITPLMVGGKPSGGAPSYVYSTQYKAVIDYANANSIPLPPEDILIQDDTAVRAAIDAGEWAAWDIFYKMNGRASYREYAKLNWRSPGNFTLIEVGTLIFDENGFTSNGTTGYLRTGWIAATHGVNYTLNSASVYAYSGVHTTSGARSLYGCRSTSNSLRTELIPINGTTNNYTINSTSSTNVANVVNSGRGGWFMNRTSSTAIRSGWDNNQVGIASVASTGLPVTEMYLLACNNNGAAINFYPGALGVFAIGSSQAGREAGINNRWNETFFNQSLGFVPVNNYVYEIHGQSNSEGIIPISGLSASLKRQFANTFIWYNPQESATWGRWCKLKAGLNNQRDGRLIWYGNEISMADRFETLQPGNALYIVKFGVGNTGVSNLFTPNWDPTTVGANGLYTRSKNFYQVPGRAALPVGTIDKGIVWVLGEEDANNASTSAQATFLLNNQNVFSAYRTDLSLPNLPITVVRVNAGISRDPTNLSNVRAVQSTATGQLCDPALNPNNSFHSSDSYTLIDTVHYQQLPFGIDLYNKFFP